MEKFTFSVDSALLGELGERLVESVHLALIELVKNSYDADATEVLIKLLPSKEGKTEIHITDNGSGMTLEDVRRYWMRIATTNKLVNATSSNYGRQKSGEKGIGRFCCRRLGTQLILETTAKVSNKKFQTTRIVFDWNRYSAGKDVTKIICEGDSKFSNSVKNTGTTLKISGKRENEWQRRKYDYVKRQLSVLAANRGTKRTGFIEDPGFNIMFIAPDFEDAESVVNLRDEIISAGWGTITGSVNKQGVARCKLNALGIGKKEITFNEKLPNLFGLNFEIGIIPTYQREKEDSFRKTKLIAKRNLREILPLWGGVQIRFKGVRVYPYGDDDWLGIDKDRGLRRARPKSKLLIKFSNKFKDIVPGRSLLNLYSMRNYIGNIDLDSRAIGFKIKANREGFLASDSFEKLRELVRFSIDWATIYRESYIRKISKEKTVLAQQQLENILNEPIDSEHVVEKAVEYIQNETKNILSILPAEQRKSVKKAIEKATDTILQKDVYSRDELHHLRLIASTSTLLLIFSHEVRNLLGQLASNETFLKKIEKKLHGKEKNEIRDLRVSLTESKSRFSDLLSMTSLIGFESIRAEPTRLALKERVLRAIKCFDLVVHEYNISIITNIPNNIVVGPILEAELLAIILNVLSNSIKSIIANNDRMEIQIDAIKKGKDTHVSIKDTGIGLDEQYFEDVFIQFVSDPRGNLYKKLNKILNLEDEYILGIGSGIGLSIIKEIINSRKGQINFVKPKKKWRSELEITLK